MSAAGEAPFMAGMEGEPDMTREKTIDLGRSLWTLHGMAHRVLQALGMAQDKALSLAEGRPAADYDEEEDERRLLYATLRELARRSGGIGHGGVNGKNSGVLTALVVLNTALLVGIGGWLLVTVQRHDTQIAVIECRLNPQDCGRAPNAKP